MDSWNNIGVYPTPQTLVSEFVSAVIARVTSLVELGGVVKILDACAGDGRLGDAVAQALVEKGYVPKLTLMDVDLSRAIYAGEYDYSRSWELRNFFAMEAKDRYDLVVSNPPYLAVTRSMSQNLGIDWERMKEGGRNLYGLALLHAVSHCCDRGLIAFIAPHGWIRNRYAEELRRTLAKGIASLEIRAFGTRRLFPGVNQDTSIQLLELDRNGNDGDPKVSISYDHASVNFSLLELNGSLSDIKARIGPFVWNREKLRISKIARGTPVIYGGNITRDGLVDLNVPKYAKRQYLANSRIPDSYFSSGPCFVVKRSMRGGPGAWYADCAFVPRGFRFVAENHVIVVEVGSMDKSNVEKLREDLASMLADRHRDSGHPNLAIDTVRDACAEVFEG